MKKILALVVAALLVLSMTSAFAATVSVQGQTTGGVINGHTFAAYQVFNGTWQGGVLTDITNGDGVDWSANMLAELNAIDGISGITDAKTLAVALDGASVETGEAVAKVLKGYLTSTSTTIANGDTLDDGYYIIIDTTNVGEGDNKATNAALLQVAGDTVTINVKTDTTTVDKKIDGDNDADTATTGLVVSNNGQVGDLVPYVITSTVPNTYYYDKYYMEFNDTVSQGLDISALDAADKFSDYKVYLGANEMDADAYELTVDAAARTIKLVVADAKGMDGNVIKLTYKAKINDHAVVGTTGNPNEVTLKYTNNPDHSGEGEYDQDEWTSVTPKKVVITYLTGIKLLKVDAANPELHLAGAVFKITGSRNVSTVVTTKGFTADDAGTYYKLADGSFTTTAPGGVLADDKYDSTETKYKASDVTEVKTETSDVKVQGTTDASGYLKFNELGAGEYTITEITAPTGYNLLSAPITLTIGFTAPASVSTGEEECTWTKTASSVNNVTFDETEGVFSITVENAKGTTLPSTGGMGTTLLYIGGSILVLAAVILLVTKRRMGAND